MIAAFLLVIASATAAPQYSGELIFPLEKWHNHSSSIVELPNGDLLVCWFHGSGERTADDVLIQRRALESHHGKWTAPFTLADTPGFPETNPVLFLDSRQRLFFLWPLIVAHKWETALMKYRISTDYQQASGPPKWEFQDNIVLMPKNIAAVDQGLRRRRGRGNRPARRTRQAPDRKGRGRILLPHGLVHPHPSARTALRPHPRAHVFRRLFIRHHGDQRRPRHHMDRQQPIVGAGCIQPSVVRKKDGTLVAYLRDNGPPPKRAHISFSKDDGVTWTRARDTEIPNPGHQPRKRPPAQRQLDHGVQRSRAVALLAGGRNQRRRGRYLEMEAAPGRKANNASAELSITTRR